MTTPTLEGSRIRLEPLTLEHLPALAQIALDPKANGAIWRYMLMQPRMPEELRRWADAALAAQATGTSMPWVTVLKAAGTDGADKVIGSTRYIDSTWYTRQSKLDTPGCIRRTTAPARMPRQSSCNFDMRSKSLA